jgi:hypothetical protein
MVPADVQIAARLDHEIVNAMSPQQPRGTVDGVALPDSAQVDTHAAMPEKHGACCVVDVDRLIIDKREARAHVSRGRNAIVLIVIELPQSAERRERYIELARRPVAHAAGIAQHGSDLGADEYWLLTRRVVDPRDIAARPPHAHQAVEPVEFLKYRIERR